MGKNIPHILKRREKNKDTSITAKLSNTTTTALKIRHTSNVTVLNDKVPNDNQDFSNNDVWKVSSDDSDIEVISTSIKPKENISKGVKTNAKHLAPILKRSKTKLKNVVPILKQSKTELKSIIPEQHKSLLILSNHTILQDKGIYDKTRISIQDLLDLSKDDEFSSINENFNNNENLLNKKSGDTSMDFFEPNDQTNNNLELEDDIILVTPQTIDKIESETMFKQSRNKSKITQQSKTFRMLSNDTDFKDLMTYGEIGALLDLADDDKLLRINDDWNNDENACNKKVYDSSTNCLPPNDILNNYIDTEDYVNIVTSQSRDNTLDDKSDKTKFNTLSAKSAFGETNISETDNVLGGMSDDSNNFSNSDDNVRRFLDSLPPIDDPSIINNAPLNINNVGDTFLSTDDTESLNSLVRLKCTSCLALVQYLNVEPQMECHKCCVKYQYQCKICTSGFNSLHSLYTHLIKFHSRGEAVHSLMIKPQYVEKPRQIRRLVYDSTELYDCQKCGMGFKIETIKNKHEASCLRNPKLNCPFCSLTMSFKKNLKEHMIKQHSESFEINEVDSIINEIVKDGNKKRKDEKVTSLLQMLQVAYCRKCDRRTPIHELLDGATTCATCGENIVFTCTDAQCSRTFLTAKALSSHVRMLHVEKREHYRCPNCLYVTMSRTDLIKHQKDCGDLAILPLRLFVCPNCDKSFKKERYLKIHLQRPEACARYKQCNLVCPKCNRKFCMQRWLQNHRCKPVAKQLEPSEPMQLTELLNTGLVPIQASEYPCPDCGKVFKQMRWFNAHKEKYCENKRVLYRCAHCRYKGFEKKKLKVHMRCVHIHLCTGKKLHCLKCGTMWTSIYSFNRHLDNCSGDYETERVKMRKQKKNNWKEMFEHI